MRIIAGRYKGRRLGTPSWEGLRPTSDKLRGTLFNVLAPRLPGARVFDGFAGTGAVGLEALSRGATHVTFAERDARAARLVAQNLALCGAGEGYTIWRGDAATALRAQPADMLFDLVLLDPPYDFEGLLSVLDASAARLAPGGVVVLERSARREPPVSSGLRRFRDIRSGDSALTLFAAAELDRPDAEAHGQMSERTDGTEEQA